MRFERPLYDRSITVGKEFVLECQLAKCSPMPNITWFKDGLKLTTESDRILTMHDSQGTVQLTLLGAKTSDSGKYSCQVRLYIIKYF